MSIQEPVSDVQLNSGADAAPTPSRPRPLRLWLPVISLVLYWSVTTAITYMQFAMFPRFVSRTLALLALLLIMGGWWLTRSRFAWRDRLLAIAVVAAGVAISSAVCDKSMNWFAILLAGLPYIFSASTLWLLVARNGSLRTQWTGFVALNVLIFGCLSLVRWEGLDGRQRATYGWRWTPTAEERFLSSAAATGSPVATEAAAPWTLQSGDWPAFRGGAAENTVTGVTLGDWTSHPPATVWRQPVGPAWSGISLVDGHLVTQEQRGGAEAVVCYDAATGKQLWVHEDKLRFEEPLSGPGPRATPTFDEGRIYTLGARSRFNCLSAADGHVIWTKDLIKDVGAADQMWGSSTSPTLIDDLVIVFAGGTEDRGLLAYRAESGELVWKCAAGKMTYSTPQLMTLAGQRQIVMHDNRALFAVDPADGNLFWEFVSANEMFVPMLQPHGIGADGLLVGWEDGLARLQVQPRDGRWTVKELWRSNSIKPGFNDFVIHRGHLYGLDDGILSCVDLETQLRTWKRGRYGHGQLLLLPDANELLVLTETGELVRVAADSAKYNELHRLPAISGKTWNHLTLAHGNLFVRNAEEMACLRVRQ